jgi:hypothetical protein
VPMNDDSAPDDSLPLFLSDDADQAGRQKSSRIRNAGLVILAVWAVGAAVLALGHPVARLAAVSASLVDVSAPDKNQAAQPARAAVDAQASPPSRSEAPTDQPTKASVEPAAVESATPAPADQPPADAKDKAASDALFMQFQAWAQKQNGKPETQQDQAQENQAQVTPEPSAEAKPPAEPEQSAETTQSAPARSISARTGPDAPAPAVQAPARSVQKQRPARELRNARAEMESARRAKAARPYWAPQEEARAPDTPAQNTDTPWLLRLFSGRN